MHKLLPTCILFLCGQNQSAIIISYIPSIHTWHFVYILYGTTHCLEGALHNLTQRGLHKGILLSNLQHGILQLFWALETVSRSLSHLWSREEEDLIHGFSVLNACTITIMKVSNLYAHGTGVLSNGHAPCHCTSKWTFPIGTFMCLFLFSVQPVKWKVLAYPAFTILSSHRWCLTPAPSSWKP